MKKNLKKKVMLAVLAGNMFCMGNAFALPADIWYGKTGNQWTTNESEAGYSSLSLTVVDGQEVNGVALADVEEIYGGYTLENMQAKNNTITFGTGNTTTVKANIYGGYSVGSSSYSSYRNTVTINGGTFSGEIYGGYSVGSSSQSAQNNVFINGGTVTGTVCGGNSENYTAIYNKITINGGTIGGEVVGGTSANDDAENNDIFVYNGIFTSEAKIIGGRSGDDARSNKVTIYGGSFTDGFTLQGGVSTNSSNSSSNVLNLNTTISGKASEVSYFHEMNFTLPADIKNGDTMLSTNILKIAACGDTATVNVYGTNGVQLNQGDVITLIQSDATNDTFTDGNYVLGGAGIVSMTEGENGGARSVELKVSQFFSQSWYGTKEGGFTRKRSEAVVSGGILNITGTEESFAQTKYFNGGFSNEDGVEVKENRVNIISGEFANGNEIFGGYSKFGRAKDNAVVINDGNFSSSSDIEWYIYGGSGIDDVSGNTVTFSNVISNNEINFDIVGGHIPDTGTGTSQNNTVAIINSDGSFGDVAGGHNVGQGDVLNNTVTISGSNCGDDSWICGGDAVNGSASNNATKIVDSIFGDVACVEGGDGSGTAYRNTITIINSDFGDYPYFYCGSGDSAATDNLMTVVGSTFGSNVSIYGGYSSAGSANENIITIDSGSVIGDYAYIASGYSDGGDATGNSVTVNDSTLGLSGRILGGYSSTGNATSNIVTISDSSIDQSGRVFGGCSDSGNAEGNVLTISGSTFAGGNNRFDSYIMGAYGSTAASENIVRITDSSFGQNMDIEGGDSDGGDTNDNVVTISNSRFGQYDRVFGGWAYGDTSSATGNNVTISDSTFGSGVSIYGGESDSVGGGASGNIVTINSSVFGSDGWIFGCYSEGAVSGNKVFIDGSSFGDDCYFIGSNSGAYDTKENILTISNCSIGNGAKIYTGWIDDGAGEIKDNILTISNSTFGNNAEIYGGCVDLGAGNAKDNIVTITNSTFGDGLKLYGGYVDTGTSSGNTLNLKTVIGGKAAEVKYFQIMNFTLPSGITADDKMLSVTNAVSLNDVTLKVYLNGYDGDDTITLIDNVSGTLGTTNVYTGAEGTTASQDYAIALDNSSLVLNPTTVTWYTVDGTKKKFAGDASVQDINEDADVTVYRGTKYVADTYALNQYTSIDVGTHTLTLDLTTETKEMTVTGELKAGSTVVSAGNTFFIGTGNLKSAVTNNGTVTLNADGILNSNSKITGGTLNINADVRANAGNIAGDSNVVASGKTLTLIGGDLSKTISGAGNVAIDGTVSSAVANFSNSGTLSVVSGTLALTDGSLTKTVANSGTVKLDGATLGGKYVTAGTLEFAKNVSINAAYVAAVTNTVDNGVTLTLTEGTLAGAVTGAGTLKIDGEVFANASCIGATTNTVEATKTLTLTEGTLAGAVTGDGTLKISDGTVIANASYIGAKTNTIDENANLTLIGTDVTLGKAIDGAGNIDIGNAANAASVTSVFSNFANEGDLLIAANSTLLTSGNINKVVSGTGTVQLTGDTILTNGKSVAGILNGNGQKVTLESGTANTVDIFTVGTLTGTLNIGLDVDMFTFTSDKLAVTTLDGSVVVNSINITKDIVNSPLELPNTENNKIVFLTKNAGSGTTSVKNSTITVTNNYKYTFTAGDTGKLNYKVEAHDLIFKGFMEGTLPDYTTQPTTLSLTDNLVNSGTGSDAITQAGDRTINLNGHTLSSSATSTIEIGSGKTLTLNGGNEASDGIVDANTNFSVAGTMNISGKTTINGTLGGTGTYTNSGTLTIADASKLTMTNGLTNSGTVNIGGGTLGAKITGGNIVLNGDVSANADYLAGAVANASSTLTLTGGSSGTPVALGGNISGAGTTVVNGVISNANVVENAVTVNSGKQLTNTGTISGVVTNNGTFITTANGITGGVTNNNALTLTDGDLGSAISGTGNAVVSGSVTNSGKKSIVQNVLTINSGAGLTTEVDVLNINNNAGPIINNGTLTLTADGTTPDTLEETVSGYGKVVFGDGINTMSIIAGNSIANAMEVKANTTLTISSDNVDDAVTNSGTVKLDAGTLEKTITGGNIQVDGAVTSSANNLQGAIQINGTKNLYLTDGTLNQVVTGDGWVNVSTTGDNEVTIAANVNKLKNQGKMKVSGTPVTFKNVEFAAGSTLTLNASDCIASAPINIAAGGSITVDATAVLCVKGVEKKTVYKIVSGVDGSFLDSDWDLSNIVGEGLKLRTVDVVGDVYQITFGSRVPENTMLKNLLADGSDNKLIDWAEGVTDKYGDNEVMATNEINAMAALGENLGVTRGALDVTHMFTVSVKDHLFGKNMMSKAKGGLRNVDYYGPEDSERDIVEIPVGLADEVMPTREIVEDTEHGSGSVWARLTHNRVKVDGLHTGDMKAQYSAQYNGVSVGYDLVDDQDITLGVALHYADGNTSNGFGGHNDSTYTGASVYAQKLMGKVVVSGEVNYLHGKNEMDQAGVSAKASTNTVSVGFDVRRPIRVGKGYVTPFAGMRYDNVHSGSYTDSLGVSRSAGSVGNFVTPVGVRYSVNIGKFPGWTLQPFAEIGYLFSFGDKGSDMKLRYGGVEDTFGFNVVDKSTFFTRAGMNFSKKNLTAGVGYDYMKSSNSHNNKWNVNLTWSF